MRLPIGWLGTSPPDWLTGRIKNRVAKRSRGNYNVVIVLQRWGLMIVME